MCLVRLANPVLNAGIEWIDTIDNFLPDATNIVCELYGCTDLGLGRLRNFPMASANCSSKLHSYVP